MTMLTANTIFERAQAAYYYCPVNFAATENAEAPLDLDIGPITQKGLTTEISTPLPSGMAPDVIEVTCLGSNADNLRDTLCQLCGQCTTSSRGRDGIKNTYFMKPKVPTAAIVIINK